MLTGAAVVDLQTALIGSDASRIVAPLRYAAFPGPPPMAEAEGAAWIVRVQELAAVSAPEMSQRIGTLIPHRDALKPSQAILIDGICKIGTCLFTHWFMSDNARLSDTTRDTSRRPFL
ncbi:CcdB family protein [Pseudotabrizicola formosa]|uniref:CcdB family protein n=1 Tax=Pseudotabrizicola formosa TaxID=2030009 RepID=UPI001FEE1B8F|nr:CcdB family protein [Pseudotabrizicola formosa]